MLDYKILANKRKIVKGNETYIDLLSTSFNDESSRNYMGKFLNVNKWYVCRPDLISLAVYGEDTYADIICKINGISNPFELAEGTILYVPYKEVLNKFFTYDSEDDLITTKDDELVIQKETFQKKLTDKRTPNQQVVGDANFVIDKSNGIVFY